MVYGSDGMSYEILKPEQCTVPLSDRRLKPNTAKKIAEQSGLTHYQGEPCAKGHSGLRYTKGSTCVECIRETRNSSVNPRQRSNKNHELALKAAALGQTIYTAAKPCKLGHTSRFVNSNNCVACDELMRQKHKITQKYNRITKEYGLSKEEYMALVALQNSSCKLCEKFEEDHFKLHVDHCHDKLKVRGLLCGKCNQGIGLLNHSPNLLRQAALYCEIT